MDNQNKNLPERKVQKVVTGTVKRQKKSETRKLADTFIAEDVSKVKSYALSEVLIPALKKAISDVVTNGIDILLYGETGKTKRYNGASDRVSYRNYNDISRNHRDARPVVSRSTYSFDDIVLTTRGEAEAVIMQMDDIISTYGFVRVADLYDLVGITGSYTDNNYGWTDIRSAEPVRVRAGYLIKLPRALPVDR